MRRQRGGEFRHARIKIRRAHLQTDSHARAIDLGQNIFGEIKLRIETLHALSQIVRVTLSKHPPRVEINVILGRASRGVGEQNFLIRWRERSKPDVMARHLVVMRGGNEAPGAVIKRKVLSLDRQSIDQRFDEAASQQPRDAIVSGRQAMAEIHGIAGNQFIAAVTTKRNCYMLSGKRDSKYVGTSEGSLMG